MRWTTYSIFAGQARWKSEGIQIGGRRSARGVVGNWFEKYVPQFAPLVRFFSCTDNKRDMDPHGPCGPTAFWKISDRAPDSDDHQVELNDFLPILDGYEADSGWDHEHLYDEDEDEDLADDEHVHVYLPSDLTFIEIDD